MADDPRDDTAAGSAGADRVAAKDIQVKIRVKPKLLAELQASATERGVPLNREIVIRLIQSFAQDAVVARIGANYEKLQSRVDEMGEEMDQLHKSYSSLLSKKEGGT